MNGLQTDETETGLKAERTQAKAQQVSISTATAERTRRENQMTRLIKGRGQATLRNLEFILEAKFRL